MCKSLLDDAHLLAEMRRKERNEVRKELAVVRQQLAEARDRAERAEREAAELRAACARPLIPEPAA